jgi:hypothetical protein
VLGRRGALPGASDLKERADTRKRNRERGFFMACNELEVL